MVFSLISLYKLIRTSKMEQKLEDLTKNPKEGKGALESLVDGFHSLVNLVVSIAAPVAGYALTGNAGVLATSASFAAATKGKKDLKTIRNESLSGAIFGIFNNYTLLPLKYLTNMGKATYTVIWAFLANAFYFTEDHLVKAKSLRGLYARFKDNYWPVMKKALRSSTIINIASSLLLPQQYMVGAVAAAAYVFRRFVTGGKIYAPITDNYKFGSSLYKRPSAQPA